MVCVAKKKNENERKAHIVSVALHKRMRQRQKCHIQVHGFIGVGALAQLP